MSEDYTFVDKNGAPIGASYHNIKVIGIGGCGNNALNQLIKLGLQGPELIAANTDPQDLHKCLAPIKIPLGEKITRRRGCGGNPEVGKAACLESVDAVKAALKDTDLLFVTAGLGGGTGSGGAPVVAEVMSQMENPPLIVAVVTTPFSWEAKQLRVAEKVMKELTKTCNSIITVSNSNVEKFAPKDCSMDEATALADEVLYKALTGIIDILNTDGRINMDFADIASVLECRGPAFMAFGEASGENRAKKALANAITNPIMSEQTIKGAKKILVNITCDKSLKKSEFEEINKLAVAEGAPDVVVFSGWAQDESLAENGTIKVTILATGLDNSQEWDKSREDVINLETLAEEPDVSVRDGADNSPRSRNQGHPRPGQQSGEAARGRVSPAAAGAASPNSPGFPKAAPPRRAVRAPGSVPGTISRYEQNAGVDPAGPNSDFYDTPTFLRNKAN